MKILILYAKVGNGHYTAAKAIKEKLEKDYPNIEVVFEDGLRVSSYIANKIAVKGYKNMTKIMPSMWGKIYSKSDTKDLSLINETAKLTCKSMTIKLKKMLREVKPDVILSTYHFLSNSCAYLKKKGKTKAKLVSLITDYGVHNVWLEDHKYYDKLLMATDEMKDDCIEYGISESKLAVTGLPVSPRFLEKYDREKGLREYGLDDKPTFLFFAGGGQGLGNSKKVFTELIKIPGDFQIVAVSGNNERQKKLFDKIAKRSNKKLVVLGYTDDVPALMNMCDFVISKPGGLTSTECLVSGKPMLIIKPIPGQEEQNAIYLVNNGAAIRAHKGEPLSHPVNTLLKDKERVQQLKNMCKKIAKPNAVDDIIKIAIDK